MYHQVSLRFALFGVLNVAAFDDLSKQQTFVNHTGVSVLDGTAEIGKNLRDPVRR